MSLNWNVEKVERDCYIKIIPEMEVPGYMASNDGKLLDPVTEALIWATMTVGLGQITKTNAVEFLARWYWVEQLSGRGRPTAARWVPTRIPPPTRKDPSGSWQQEVITIKDVLDHVGLSTNVSKEPLHTWRRRIGELYFTELMSELKRAQEQLTPKVYRCPDGHEHNEAGTDRYDNLVCVTCGATTAAV